jgi:hypothetical protein
MCVCACVSLSLSLSLLPPPPPFSFLFSPASVHLDVANTLCLFDVHLACHTQNYGTNHGKSSRLSQAKASRIKDTFRTRKQAKRPPKGSAPQTATITAEELAYLTNGIFTPPRQRPQGHTRGGAPPSFGARCIFSLFSISDLLRSEVQRHSARKCNVTALGSATSQRSEVQRHSARKCNVTALESSW